MVAILRKYGGELYNSALTKLVYLVDIEAVKRFGDQVSHINWVRDNFGPFVWDIVDQAEKDRETFEVVCDDFYKNKRRIILKNPEKISSEQWIIDIIDHIYNTVPNPKENFLEFTKYVYNTIPMSLSTRKHSLNIKEDILTAIEVEQFVDETLNNPEWREAIQYLAVR